MLSWTLFEWLLLGVGIGVGAVGFFLIQAIHLGALLIWCDAKTDGVGYYGLSRPARRRFKRILWWHRLALTPILWLAARRGFDFAKGSFSVQGLAGPKGSCNPERFREAMQYTPQADDVFVASQMKSGTTWLQHLVLQVLTRGKADLAQRGTALNALSPWLESSKAISLEQAPLIGKERPSRVIKTHFPASHCPYAAGARYVYVARHPVSCFASCADFVGKNLGSFAPSLESCETWFQSKQLMWWGSWPEHVAGWWQWSEQRENVLFLRFEEMKHDLAEVACRVAEFLQIAPLSDSELAEIARKCSFENMRDNADCFEMNPPHLLQTSSDFFISGKLNRYRSIPEDMGARIGQWCAEELATRGVPLERLYPALAPEACKNTA